MNNLKRAGNILARITLGMSGFALLTLVGLTVVEVCARYFFDAPINGKQDLSKLILAISIFLALPVVTLRREHIDVDLLDGWFRASVRFYRDRLTDFFVGGTLLIMSFWLWDRADKFYDRGSTTEALFIPLYPLVYLIATIAAVSGGLLLFWGIIRIFVYLKFDRNTVETDIQDEEM